MSASYPVSGLYIFYQLIAILFIISISSSNSLQQVAVDNNHVQSKLIEVYIIGPENDGHFALGSSIRLQCRFRLIGISSVQSNLRFNLRWLRSVAGAENQNQTITETDIDPSFSPDTIIAATTRIWSVRKEDGLDLELNYLQSNDSGAYYCQAITVQPDPTILNETFVQISANNHNRQIQQNDNHKITNTNSPPASELTNTENENNENSTFDSFQLYSQENLSKLLPSLKIIPSSFNQIPIGETIQLACITNDLDPDPEPDKLVWTFEQIGNHLDLLDRQPFVNTRQMPYNVTILGNVLIIWSMLEEHSGLYKCTYRMDEFNLTAQASAEVQAIRGEQIYSAPLVFVKPELVRLSINGSAGIQCETTGYPPPELIWYRVNDVSKSELIVNNNITDMSSSSSGHYLDQARISESHIDGLVVEQIYYKDLPAYCRLNRCLDQAQDSVSSSSSGRLKLTGFSIIHLHDAKASHQGQYVCQASNKHGSNQASSIVDVEIKEAPLVSIAAKDREQTIVLPSSDSSVVAAHQTTGADGHQQLNVTFKCMVTAGRPRPRLRWLRTGTGSAGMQKFEVDNLDLYDLTKISSATSNVKTIAEDNGSSLTLVISTISLDDEGDYICFGENEVGRQSAVARLIVQKPASIRILQSSPYVAKLNDSFHLDCLISGHPLPMDIEWSRTDRGSFFSLISRSTHSSGQERAVLKFDRVTREELGEYTCNARDPLNTSNILRDTIMVVAGDQNAMDSNNQDINGIRGGGGGSNIRQMNENTSLMPKLMVRPTKVNALIGSNVTLDCLTVSGLQPTLVEWLAPTNHHQQQQQQHLSHHHQTNIRAYYREGDTNSNGGHLLQFGSKLRIFNVSKEHEGIYQCKGKNRLGIEIAPALIKVINPQQDEWGDSSSTSDRHPYTIPSNMATGLGGHHGQVPRTKVAKYGTNIELKCQVNGIDQPVTSWSRDGQELPKSSVQIGHNLWIQNVTNKDNGLYVCSARSKEPNRIIQAKINLLVEGGDSMRRRLMKNLEAKIVASKGQVIKGDSITLECIISGGAGGNNSNIGDDTTLSTADNNNTTDRRGSGQSSILADDLDEVERNVIWTNLRSGQSLFQDNVYILGNLLIIYDLKFENSATYRCNYNELAQYTDYKLQVSADPTSQAAAAAASANTEDRQNSTLDYTGAIDLSSTGSQQRLSGQIVSTNGQKAELKQLPQGSKLILDCNQQGGLIAMAGDYYWTRDSQRIPFDNKPIMIESVRPRDAGIYGCHQLSNKHQATSNIVNYLVNILVPTARFTQSPVSFITLPTISGANQQQLEIELKFLPETEHGLLLFNGQQQQQQQLFASNKSSSGFSSTEGDYLALGMVDGGYLEFRFELGDGTTILKSNQPLSLNHWHRVMIERNRRGAVMWIDDQPAVSNSSTGKFFNLNLDSVLFIGGHQQFLYRSANGMFNNQQLYGYSKGFQGCINLLRISRQEINLMARNRSVAVGIFECHKSECNDNYCSTYQSQVNGVCQIDRSDFDQRWEPTGGQVSAQAGQRCVCMPGMGGDDKCSLQVPQVPITLPLNRSSTTATATTATTTTSSQVSLTNSQQVTNKQQQPGRACELLTPCSSQGTVQCQSLTSQSYNCHCKIGFTGNDCSKIIVYDDEHSIQFNQHSYLRMIFKKAQVVESNLRNQSSANQLSLNTGGSGLFTGSNDAEFNATNYAKQISMGDHQNISFNLQTNSSFGLLFYTGQLTFNIDNTTATTSSTGNFAGANHRPSIRPTSSNQSQQTSKSMLVNLMSRLSQGSVSDYLAIALIDGHVEVSYELGSGVAILRSILRVNDNQLHTIQMNRTGKFAKLIIDQVNKYEGNSPGKLSMLNSDQEDFYIGGLPLMSPSTSSQSQLSVVGQASVIYSTHFANFVGCISHFEINSLGPLDLIHSNHLTEIHSAQNLTPCSNNRQQSSAKKPSTTRPNKPYTSPSIENDDKEPDELRKRRSDSILNRGR